MGNNIVAMSFDGNVGGSGRGGIIDWKESTNAMMKMNRDMLKEIFLCNEATKTSSFNNKDIAKTECSEKIENDFQRRGGLNQNGGRIEISF